MIKESWSREWSYLLASILELHRRHPTMQFFLKMQMINRVEKKDLFSDKIYLSSYPISHFFPLSCLIPFLLFSSIIYAFIVWSDKYWKYKIFFFKGKWTAKKLYYSHSSCDSTNMLSITLTGEWMVHWFPGHLKMISLLSNNWYSCLFFRY